MPTSRGLRGILGASVLLGSLTAYGCQPHTIRETYSVSRTTTYVNSYNTDEQPRTVQQSYSGHSCVRGSSCATVEVREAP